ncbi:DUF6931 family protein [Pseudoxanthomonas putridarboris]|uniref:Secreted protein n=1 Tax=Pseudoxanthomonas putridarboris TaxID=752605 RepID=A0ABU9J392_9GAMM
MDATIILAAARQMRIPAVALACIGQTTMPHEAVRALVAAGHRQAALELLMRLLPKRYAVAWLCQCARAEPLDTSDREGVTLAEAWTKEPTEPHRRAALRLAAERDYGSVGAWIAAAAGWSGGSLSEEGQPPSPAPDHLTAIAATAAVNGLAALDTARFEDRRDRFIGDALGLLDGPAH